MGEIIRNCRLCDKPMESSPFTMCKTCLVESDRVRNYIIKHPKVTLEQISLSANVPYEKVICLAKLGLEMRKEMELQ